MEATDTVPSFLLFAFQGCNAPSLLGEDFGGAQANVRPMTIPLILMLAMAATMLFGFLLWWREVAKGIPMALIGIALITALGFLGYQANDIFMNTSSFGMFVSNGNYLLAVGEFSLYLVFVLIMIAVSFVLVWREVGWEAERNLLILSTGGAVVLAISWLFFSFAVWNCV